MRLRLPAAAVLGAAGLALFAYGISAPPHLQPPIAAAKGSGLAEKSLSPTHRQISRPTSSSSTISAVPVPALSVVNAPTRLATRLPSTHKPASSAPVLLALPSLGIASSLGPARGLNSDGTVDDAPLTGPTWSLPWWYDDGPSPGQGGSAVILGHVDSALGQGGLGVFFRLGDVQAGQRIDVTLANQTTTHWTVTSVRLYADDLFPDSVVYARTGPPVLRLVTCGGAFDWSTHEYESSVVVTAHLAISS